MLWLKSWCDLDVRPSYWRNLWNGDKQFIDSNGIVVQVWLPPTKSLAMLWPWSSLQVPHSNFKQNIAKAITTKSLYSSCASRSECCGCNFHLYPSLSHLLRNRTKENKLMIITTYHHQSDGFVLTHMERIPNKWWVGEPQSSTVWKHLISS